MKKLCSTFALLLFCLTTYAADQFVTFRKADGAFQIIGSGKVVNILLDEKDQKGIGIAVNNLIEDFNRVCGMKPQLLKNTSSENCIIVGSLESTYIKQLIKAKKLDKKQLENKNEKFIITTVNNPLQGVEKAVVIAGSDRRGTIYGVYELAEQMGVSPWYWWMDVPVVKQTEAYVMPGVYTDGEPAVKYRGIFLNDEAPCLTGWVKQHYGTDFGGHRFYSDVFELILRLKGNFLWPAMWSWAFYGDDPLNSKTADEMGVVISTSHHEPMARNHQEWTRKRNEHGAWNYATNKKVLDQFFQEGIERMKHTEDVVTIGMRGDGDAAMSDATNVKLLETVVENQRKIIQNVTGKPAKETPQVWALYKEVLDYYDKGMRVPDDVIMLLCDDNWGNVCRLPAEKERNRPGGWGLYYHVDYVGAPRNTKWLNVTPIQGMWEQLHLAYEYGVEKLWVLNVGDLKPMEYPITLFLDMAWNPDAYTAENFMKHPRKFCAQAFGEEQADEAARILNLYSKYNGRVTPEMLDAKTYNLETGEWKQVADDYTRLEAEALRQYMSLASEYRDAYKQLLLFPVQAMSNLYEMYYAQAMNHKLYAENNPMANHWANQVEKCFARDKALSYDYNNVMADGKWKNMMIQKHIGYTIWNDNFPADKLPEVFRIAEPEKAVGGYVFTGKDGYVAMEAEHFFENKAPQGTEWKIIPDMGRFLSAVTLMPYTSPVNGASLSYKMTLPLEAKGMKTVKVIVVVKSTLAFQDVKGHKYTVGFRGGNEETVNFNHNLNELPENVYSVFYPTVARRVIEKEVTLELPVSEDGTYILDFKPLNPAVVLEKIVIDCGGYKKSYLYMNESSCERRQ
ncbi:MAG: glycosyl hydrolase 115 family protein [Bacteroides sp.]